MSKQQTWLDRSRRLNLKDFQEEPSYQAKVDEEKMAYLALEATDLAREFTNARNKKRQLEDMMSEISLTMEALSQLLREHLEAQQLQSISTGTGTSVFLQAEPYPSTVNRNTLREWVVAQGMDEILSVNYQTLTGLVKERLLNGLEPPPGVEVFLKIKARVRGGNQREE